MNLNIKKRQLRATTFIVYPLANTTMACGNGFEHHDGQYLDSLHTY